ncbi:MAG: hypothetical protein CL824_00985 [Crocinitomicaceae bacterium]|nr:hypothetical protein [Crocinitomicaceae bacterium]
MKETAILLNGPISNDSRVIKTIKSLMGKMNITLFYLDGNPSKDAEIFNSIHVKLISFKRKNNLKIKLLKHSFFCREFDYFKSKIIDTNIKYDYIWANDLPLLKVACQTALKLNSKVIYDSHEIYIETINQFFPVNSSFIKRTIFNSLIKIMRIHGEINEKKFIKKTHAFITVNESILNLFNQKHKLPYHHKSIMNVPYLNETKNNNEVKDFRALFDWKKDDKIILYQGFLNMGRGLEILIKSMSFLEQKYKLIILGNGPIKNNLEKMCNDLDLNNQIKFMGVIPNKDLISYTKGADLGINLLEELNLSKAMASPNKLFEYIHADIPVLCSKSIENNRFIKKFPLGQLVQNHPKDVAKGIKNVVNSSFEESLFISAKNEYSWEKQEASILELFD